MKKLFCSMSSVLLLTGLMWMNSYDPAQAAEHMREQEQMQIQEREHMQIYGSDLMTEEERLAYRNRMRSAETDEERERIRNEHHERMKERAYKEGITLPDQPPDRGMGRGMGTGGGMGPGGGKR